MKKIIGIFLAVMIVGTFACKSKSTFIPPEDRFLSSLDSLNKHVNNYNVSLEKLLQSQRKELKYAQELDSIYTREIKSLKN